MTENHILLSTRNLTVGFSTDRGVFHAVDNVGFSVRQGRVFTIVGESGSGKTTTALAIMRLLASTQGRILSGQIFFEGRDLFTLTEKQMCRIRGNKIAMIFQEPAAALNPILTVGSQIAEVITLHQAGPPKQAWLQAVEMLRTVEIPDPDKWARSYPHQLSGGMQQRVMIAIAISCRPSLLIADEPTAGLDATVGLTILNLLDRLRHRDDITVLLITHDLRLAVRRADDLAVMYASRIVEMGESRKIFAQPRHPYTQGLLCCSQTAGTSLRRIAAIPGTTADPLCYPTGCKFHPRCWLGSNDRLCQTLEPELRELEPDRWAACWHAPGYEKHAS
jgi:oligopeptide/dipeptide ABC transporter ATP-binding protein